MQKFSTKYEQTNLTLHHEDHTPKRDLLQGCARMVQNPTINMVYYVNKIKDKNHTIISTHTENQMSKSNIHTG